MNILFLTVSRIADVSERGIYTDLLRTFRDEGHHVYTVSPTERRNKRQTSISIDNNISVLNVKTLNIQKTNLIEKGVATMLIEGQFLNGIKAHFKNVKFDLVIYSTPPITFTRIINFIKKRDNAVSYLLLKDIFPQNAVDLGIIKKDSVIYSYFKRKEKALYAVSDYIGCMSPANAHYVVTHNPQIDSNKVEVNPNSIALINIETDRGENVRQRKVYSIPDDATIFAYGGNLGKPQGIDFLLEVLKSNQSNKAAFFLIIGTGTEYAKLDNWIQAVKPENVLLLKSLPKPQYDALLAICNVGMIFLDKRFTIPNFPSRLLSYLENKMPVIAATDVSTDMGQIIEKNNFGKWCLSGDLVTFNSFLDYFCSDANQISAMGLNGYNFMTENYLVANSYHTIMKHFNV
jgi:hypothetical protein